MTLKRSLALGIIGLALVYSISGFVPAGTLPAETAPMENLRSFLERVGLIEQRPQLAISNSRVYPGGFLALYVAPTRPEDSVRVSSSFLGDTPLFFPYQEGQIAFLPVNYRTDPGSYLLRVEVMRYGDVINTMDQALTVYSREFPIQRLNVSSDLQAKRDESLWEQDRKYTTVARENPNSVPLWAGAFLQPVEGRISTEFGLTRYINGVDSGRHSGLDIAAPTGTPLVASNSGVVTLARMLHVTGNTVIIDHGLNLFTSYSHLDQIEVEPNQQVKKGERIGTVGNTGFSTGPHLHWSVVIGGEFVDPALVTKDDPKNMFPDQSNGVDKES